MKTYSVKRKILFTAFALLTAVFMLAAVVSIPETHTAQAETTSVEYTVDADCSLISGTTSKAGTKQFVKINDPDHCQSIMRFAVPKTAFSDDLASITLYLEVSGSEKSNAEINPTTILNLQLCSNPAEAAQEWPENDIYWKASGSTGEYPIRGNYTSTATFSFAEITKTAASGAAVVEMPVAPSFFEAFHYEKEVNGVPCYLYTVRMTRPASAGAAFYVWSKEKATSDSSYKAPTLIFNYSDDIAEHVYGYEDGASVAVKDTFVNIDGASNKTYNFGGDTTVYINRYRRAYMQFETTALRDGIDGKYLSLRLNMTTDVSDVDLSKLYLYVIPKVAKDGETANYDWVEGVLSGVVPSDAAITGGTVADVLPREDAAERYAYFSAEDKVLSIDFHAGYLTDEVFDQVDPETEKHYITLCLMVPDNSDSPSFYFYSKEGETETNFAPYIVLKDREFAFYEASVSLNDALTVNYYTVSKGYLVSDGYMSFTVNGETFTAVASETADYGVYKFALPLTPQLMAENISAEFVAGGEAPANYPEFSVKAYLKAVFATDGVSDKIKTIIADVLAYGEAAMNYSGYVSSASINDDETVSAYATVFEAPSASDKGRSGEALETARFTSATLFFDNVNRIGFKVTAEDVSAITVKLGKNELTATDLGNGEYIYLTDGVYPNCFDAVFTVTMYLAEDGSEGETVTFSVNSYVYDIVGSSEDENMVALAKALYNYGRSVEAYLAD